MMSQATDTPPLRRKISRIVERTFAIVGAIAAVVGLISGGIAISDHFKKISSAADFDAAWVANGAVRNVSDGENLRGTVLAQKIILSEGTATLAPETILIADVIELGPKASLRGSKAFVIARKVTGGRFDFSGSPGQESGAMGSPGGEIHIITNSALGSSIDVSGGSGSDGEFGQRGQDGRDGRCDGFGRYRGADRGGNGEAGSRGGDGGHAGIAVLLTATTGPISITATGGSGGLGGAGGAPGQGGRGCVGLGGSQSNAPSGTPGVNGESGNRGRDSVIMCRVLPSAELRRSANTIAQSPERITHEVTRLSQLASASCG